MIRSLHYDLITTADLMPDEPDIHDCEHTCSHYGCKVVMWTHPTQYEAPYECEWALRDAGICDDQIRCAEHPRQEVKAA